MKFIKKLSKYTLFVLFIPTLYLMISLVLSSITVERENQNQASEKAIYLVTNGIHLDIVMHKNEVGDSLLYGLNQGANKQLSDQYFAFGWGDESFYLNTQYLEDLTIKNTVNALFLKSSTLMHVTRYESKQAHWIKIPISDNELTKLNAYIQNSFQLNNQADVNNKGMKIILQGKGYSSTDDFYKAKGSYSAINTCNSWVNSGFKQSGLKASVWTPFDFGLINKYE